MEKSTRSKVLVVAVLIMAISISGVTFGLMKSYADPTCKTTPITILSMSEHGTYPNGTSWYTYVSTTKVMVDGVWGGAIMSHWVTGLGTVGSSGVLPNGTYWYQVTPYQAKCK